MSEFAGPLQVSSNGRYFVDARGQPFFWLGDTAWPLFGQYSLEEAQAYFANRARKGFSVIQGVLAWGGGTGFEDSQPGANFEGNRPWLDGPGHPNEAYFSHVDRLFRIAAENNLVLAALPTWGYYVTDIHTFNEENAYVYGLWLGKRYKNQPNLVWVNGGDRIATGYESIYRALAHGLREGDGGAHLITYHPSGWRSSAQYFHEDDWLDFNMIQTWTEWSKIYPSILADTLLTPVKPVVLGEPAYENGPEYPQGPITPLIVRRQAWWAFMAGGFFTYGQNQMWRMEPGWTETFDTPGSNHMAVFKRVVNSLPWWKRVPDQSLFASGVSSERSLNTAVRSSDGSWAMIYLSSPCSVQVHLDKIAARQVKARWINPQDGSEKDAGIFATGNLLEGKIWPDAKKQWFSTPDFWEDALLVLDGA
jgi:hypothetical protein